jgi:hypothetical protein
MREKFEKLVAHEEKNKELREHNLDKAFKEEIDNG